MPYYLYILRSTVVDRFYTGSSDNPLRRIEFHNSLEKGFTARYRPWKIVFTKEFRTKKEAQAAERKIKAWKSKSMIEKLIRGEINI